MENRRCIRSEGEEVLLTAFWKVLGVSAELLGGLGLVLAGLATFCVFVGLVSASLAAFCMLCVKWGIFQTHALLFSPSTTVFSRSPASLFGPMALQAMQSDPKVYILAFALPCIRGEQRGKFA